MNKSLRRMKCVTCFVLVSLVLPATFRAGAVAAPILLPQTGQKSCYNSSGNTLPSCVGTGQDGDKLAGVKWPEPRFTITYCNSSGPCASQAADCDGNAGTDMVTDNLTGLVWARSGNLPNGARTWYEALDFAEGLTICGHDDWRLPNINELKSALNFGVADNSAWLASQGFVSFTANRWYLSSTTDASYSPQAWALNAEYNGGYTRTELVNKNWLNYVWPLRGSSTGPAALPRTGQTQSWEPGDDGYYQSGAAWPDPRFTLVYCNDQGPCPSQTDDCDSNIWNDVVTDNLTGLTWTRQMNATVQGKTWDDALTYASTLSRCGYSDWRLPNIVELQSLLDYSQYHPALPPEHPFYPVYSVDTFLSSTTLTALPDRTLRTESYAGDLYSNPKSSKNFVWPVRGASGTPQEGGTLTVTIEGNGKGAVTGKNIKCQKGSCTYKYTATTDVTLTARPSGGSSFTGWSGCDSTSGTTCQVTMNRDATVKAGFTLPPRIAVSPMSLNFGPVKQDVNYRKTVTVRNNGQSDLVIAGIAIEPANATEFSASGCADPVAGGNSCDITVSLTATSLGAKTARLAVASNDPKKPSVAVKLSASAKPPKISVSPAALSFKTPVGGTSPPGTVTIRNTGVSDLVITAISAPEDSSFAVDKSDCLKGPVVQKGTCKLTVTFTPASQGTAKSTLAISSNATPAKVKLSGKGM